MKRHSWVYHSETRIKRAVPSSSIQTGNTIPLFQFLSYLLLDQNPCQGHHNSWTKLNLILKLHWWMHYMKWTTKKNNTLVIPVFELSVFAISPCPGHNYRIIWNLLMKLNKLVSHIKTVSHETRKTTVVFYPCQKSVPGQYRNHL